MTYVTRVGQAMILTDEQLDEIRERNAKRTPGEWETSFGVHGDPVVTRTGQGRLGIIAVVDKEPADYGRADCEFIANSPADITNLLETVDALKTRLALYES